MAIEIPPLAADRLPHPDWLLAAAAGRYAVPAVRLLAALDGLAVPGPLLEGLRRAAASGAPVELLLSADRGMVQVVVEGRRIPLTGAARDAALTVLGQSTGPAPAVPPAPAALLRADAALAARVAAVGAQVQEARTHPGVTVAGRDDDVAPAPALLGTEPVLSGPSPAARLAAAVDTSSLFLEAHVAQWLRGERSLAQLQDEVARLADRLPADGNGEQRAARQLDALHHQLVCLRLPAWPGQALELAIGRDPEHPRDAPGADPAASGLFQATLRLDLPRLGTLEVRLRLLQETVGVRIRAADAAAVAPALPQLASALAGRGLHLVAVDLAPAGAAPAAQRA